MKTFDRNKIKVLPLSERENKINIEDVIVNPDSIADLPGEERFQRTAEDILKARDNGKAVILSCGAHLIRNGLGLVLRNMINKGYVTHIATNGAGSIHDWEFAFQGQTCEDVRKYLTQGQFGIWDETGRYINLAITQGARDGLGYGESVGRMISQEGLEGLTIKHPFKKYSVQEAAFGNGIPFTVHPGFGYDIIYTHPLSDGASIGKASERDFLGFTESVSNLEGGVYLSIGSAVMSPMILEKALSMARNVEHQKGKKINDFRIVINDIQEGNWKWGTGIEPPKDNPAYYLRFCKSFERMGARDIDYIQQDNKSFLTTLYQEIKQKDKK